jgi:hypothetical protein
VTGLFFAGATQTGAEAVIPPKRNRKVQRPHDIDLYQERNIIERTRRLDSQLPPA